MYKKILHLAKMTTFFVMATFIPTINTNAQNNCEGCNAVLLNGAFDQHQQQFNSSFESDLDELFKHDYTYWKSIETSRSSQAKANGSYGLFSASAGAAKSESEKEQEYKRLRDEYNKESTQRQKVRSELARKTASKIITDAWEACLKINCGKEKLIGDITGGPKEYTISLTFTPKDGADPESILVNSISIVPTSIKAKWGTLKEGALLKKYETATLIIEKEKPGNEGTVTIAVEKYGNIKIQVQGINEVVTPTSNTTNYSSMPVGTIISSLFDFETFSVVVGQSPFDSPSKLGWAPADGRPVTGSIFSTLSKKDKIPDLRGNFLRGLNKFSSMDLQRNARAYDPDENRAAGDFQTSNVGHHVHDLPKHRVFVSVPVRQGEGFDTGLASGPFFADNRGSGISRKVLSETSNPINVNESEVRPANVAVYYYVKIN